MSGHTWIEVLADWYGVQMKADTAERWQGWVKEEMKDVNPGEAAEALLWAAKTQRYSFPGGKPTVGAVIMCIKWRRKELAAERRQQAYRTDDVRGYLNGVWGQVMRAMRIGDPELAWNTLCSPKHYAGFDRDPNPEECKQLYDKLMERHPDFKRPTFNWDMDQVGVGGAMAMTVEEMYA
jgi:hypothetical protein